MLPLARIAWHLMRRDRVGMAEVSVQEARRAAAHHAIVGEYGGTKGEEKTLFCAHKFAFQRGKEDHIRFSLELFSLRGRWRWVFFFCSSSSASSSASPLLPRFFTPSAPLLLL